MSRTQVVCLIVVLMATLALYAEASCKLWESIFAIIYGKPLDAITRAQSPIPGIPADFIALSLALIIALALISAMEQDGEWLAGFIVLGMLISDSQINKANALIPTLLHALTIRNR